MSNFFKSLIGVIITVLLVVLLVTCVHRREKNPIDALNPEDTTITVTDVLNMREELRLAKYNDSVFLAIPRQILTAILATEGTDLSIKQIVHTYIANKDFYDNFVKKAMDAQKEYPDTGNISKLPVENSDSSLVKVIIKNKLEKPNKEIR